MNVLLACVAENNAAWCTKVENLALSVRRFGGRLAEATFVACFVEGVEPDFEQRLARLGVESRTVARSTWGPPATNKLAMLDLGESHDFGVLVAVDCDVIVTGDAADAFASQDVRATPEHAAALTDAQWMVLYNEVGVELPTQRIRMLHNAEYGFPYYSSGVLSIPRSHCADLRNAWQRHCEAYIKVRTRPELSSALVAFTDQVALTSALQELGLSVDPLPAALNLCTTVPIHPEFRDQVRPPFILHYRSEIDELGFLYASIFEDANPSIDALNRARAEHLGLDYSGLQKAPTARRLVRWLESQRWYSAAPIRALRRSRFAAAPRRLAQRRAQ